MSEEYSINQFKILWHMMSGGCLFIRSNETAYVVSGVQSSDSVFDVKIADALELAADSDNILVYRDAQEFKGITTKRYALNSEDGTEVFVMDKLSEKLIPDNFEQFTLSQLRALVFSQLTAVLWEPYKL